MLGAQFRDGSHGGSSAGPGREHRRKPRRARRADLLRLLHCLALVVTVLCACFTSPGGGLEVLAAPSELAASGTGATRWASALRPFRQWQGDAGHSLLDLQAEESDANDSSPDVTDDDAIVLVTAALPPRTPTPAPLPRAQVDGSRRVIHTRLTRGPPV